MSNQIEVHDSDHWEADLLDAVDGWPFSHIPVWLDGCVVDVGQPYSSQIMAKRIAVRMAGERNSYVVSCYGHFPHSHKVLFSAAKGESLVVLARSGENPHD